MQHLLQVTTSTCGGGPSISGQFWSVKTRTNPFWVFDKDLKNNLAKFSGQILGVKQGSQFSQQLEELGEIWAEISRSTFGQFLRRFLWVISG